MSTPYCTTLGTWHLKKGAQFAIGIGRQLDKDNARLLLSSALESLDQQS